MSGSDSKLNGTAKSVAAVVVGGLILTAISSFGGGYVASQVNQNKIANLENRIDRIQSKVPEDMSFESLTRDIDSLKAEIAKSRRQRRRALEQMRQRLRRIESDIYKPRFSTDEDDKKEGPVQQSAWERRLTRTMSGALCAFNDIDGVVSSPDWMCRSY